jgi:aspartate/methionine/tyrosine aminotransferase
MDLHETPTSGPFSEIEDPVLRLQLPERAGSLGRSAREAEVVLGRAAPAGIINATHFDTAYFPPPPWAAEAFAEAARHGADAYTPYRGHRDVRRTLAATLEPVLGVPIDPDENVAITSGTQGGLFAAIAALAKPKTRVTLIDPDYFFYARIARFLDLDVGYVPLDAGSDFSGPDLSALEAEFAQGSRLMVMSHPHNPTGSLFSQRTVQTIASLCQRYGVTVIADELYCRLRYDNAPFHHLASQAGMTDRVVTLLGPSKTESMSGYRLGVVVAPSRLLDRIENIVSLSSVRAPAYSQQLLARWMRDDRDWLTARINALADLRQSTVDALLAVPGIALRPPAATAYAWVDCGKIAGDGGTVALSLLQRARVMVTPGIQFGPSSGTFIRLCFGQNKSDWTSALHRIASTLKALKSHDI